MATTGVVPLPVSVGIPGRLFHADGLRKVHFGAGERRKVWRCPAAVGTSRGEHDPARLAHDRARGSRGNLTYLRLERVIDRALLHPDRPQPAPERGIEGLLGSYVANFWRFRNAEMKVIQQDGVLAVDVPGVYVTELGPPDARGRRAAEVIPGVSFSFEVDARGRAVALIWHDEGGTYRLPRAPHPGAGGFPGQATGALLPHRPRRILFVEMPL